MKSRPCARYVVYLLMMIVAAACTGPDSVVEPGPGEDETTTTTQTSTTVSPTEDDSEDSEETEDDNDPVEVETADADADAATTTTTAPVAASSEGQAEEAAEARPDVFVLDENSENAAVFTELADSGLLLTIDEQACADAAASSAIDDGSSELNAIIDAVRSCAAPVAIDDFASELITAGGAGLPPDEAACVSSRLQSGDEYQAFWAALLEEEQFDFLLSELEVQNRYLDLYSECVSVGRAVSQQAAVTLSAPSVGCIDDLYQDREFVRVTIEADLSGNAEELERIADQITTCLTAEEQALLG